MRHSRRYRRLRAPGAWLALALLLATRSSFAQIQPASDEIAGTVLSIDDGELVLDLGTGQGLEAGASVEIWRPLRLKHPVTGRAFADRFRLGTVVVDQVRQSLSLAHVSGKLSRAAERGDIIIMAKPAPPKPVPSKPVPLLLPPPPPSPPPPRITREAPPPAPPPPAAPPPVAPHPHVDEDARTVQAMLDALQGSEIATRVARYRVFVEAHPQSPYSAVLREEIVALESATRPAPATDSPRVNEAAHLEVKSAVAPEGALEGKPIRITVELTDESRGAVINIRKKGPDGYLSTPMQPEGPRYYGVTLSGAAVSRGDIEYFIDATRKDGTSIPVLGSPDNPKVIAITSLPIPSPKKIDATASVWTDYADYNRLRGNDRVSQTEGYFGVRLGDVGVRAVRLGFGVYRGVGGSTHDLDVLHESPRAVGLTYGYLETEFGLIKEFSIITRGSVGLLDGGMSGGGQLLFRIGNDLRTNLLLGGEFLGGVGVRSIAELDLNVFPRFPMALRTEVSNQPAGTSSSQSIVSGTSDGKSGIGARGIAQLGFKVAPPILLFARASVEGRTIEHAGPGGGGGVTVTW